MNTNNNPEITIIIATRNRGNIVVNALDSIYRSNYKYFNVVVTDQSTNNRTELSLGKFNDNPSFKYLRSSTIGASNARNIAIDNSDTELIGIIDDDCVIPQNWIESLINAFSSDENIGIIFGNVQPAKHDSSKGFIPTYVRHSDYLAKNIYDKNNVEGLSACMGIRKSVWKSVNGFDPNLGPGSYLKCGEDSDLTIRALLNGYYVYETPDFYLIHYGFRNWNEVDKLIYRYWYGTGAMFAKHLKCGHLSILILLSGLAYRWAFKQSRVIQGLGTNKHRLKRLFSFFKGFYSGLRMPVDRKKQLFIDT